VLDPFFSMEL